MAAPKFFKDLVLYNINGRNITVPTYVGVKTGNYKYILKLDELSKVGFTSDDFMKLYEEINRRIGNRKLYLPFDFILYLDGTPRQPNFILRSGYKLTDDNKVTAPQTNQGALMSEIETIVQEIQRNKLNPQASQTTPTFQEGDFILYNGLGTDTYVFKVASGLSSNGQYKISYRDYNSDIDEEKYISSAELTQKAKLLSIKNQQRFIVNTKQTSNYEVIIEEEGQNDFIIYDTKGASLTNPLTEEEVKKYLYARFAKEVKTTPVQSATFTKEPDDYVFSKKSGYIYGVYVDKTSSRNYDLLAYDNGVEIKNQIDESTLNNNYRILLLIDGLKFSIPAGGLPRVRLVYTKSQTGGHLLSYENGSMESYFAFPSDVKLYLFKAEAQVILDGVEEADNLKDSTEKSTPAAFEEDEIQTLNKDISQLMFFKSILSPIDFEKKIEISQEIEKKQKRVNDLNFYMLEKRFKSDNIFEDLFEQSFTPISNAYTGVYAVNPEDTDFFTPNGKKSELSDALNVMIRTPQFKAWFGDWELAYQYKDTDAVEIDCSKVLTENFEPLVVWHGTGQEFSYFKFDSFPAAYFAVRREYSQFFADLHGGGDGFVIPFFLNIRNPLDLTHFRTNDVSVKDFFDYLFLQTGLDMDDLGVNPIFMDSSLKPMQTWIFIRNNPNMLKRIAELKNFDGIHFYETNPNIKDKSSPAYETEAYITFSANQSKIADPNRGMILLASMKSFILEKGGAI